MPCQNWFGNAPRSSTWVEEEESKNPVRAHVMMLATWPETDLYPFRRATEAACTFWFFRHCGPVDVYRD
eukprot:6134053-Amphidinium_carterae.1